MSLILDMGSSPPGIEVKTGFSNRVWLGRNTMNFMGAAEFDISMKDFCCIVDYVMTNTDLDPDDPRLELQKRIAALRITAGWSKHRKRLAPP